MRTQITLNDEELELLDRAARASGASRSELIRRAIHTAYGSRSKKNGRQPCNEAPARGGDETLPVPTTSTPFATTSTIA